MERAAAIAKKVYGMSPRGTERGDERDRAGRPHGGVCQAPRPRRPAAHAVPQLRALHLAHPERPDGQHREPVRFPHGRPGPLARLPRGGEHEEDAQGRAHPHRFRHQLPRLPYGPHADVRHRPHARPFVRAYEVCREIQYRVLDRALQGATAAELFAYSKELAEESGFGPYYLGYDRTRSVSSATA